MAREVEIDHLRANIEVPISRPVKLADINAQLEREGLDLVLVVGHWDGEGEPSPTTLELMTPAEHKRRCEASRTVDPCQPEPMERIVERVTPAGIIAEFEPAPKEFSTSILDELGMRGPGSLLESHPTPQKIK